MIECAHTLSTQIYCIDLSEYIIALAIRLVIGDRHWLRLGMLNIQCLDNLKTGNKIIAKQETSCVH